MDTEYLLVKIYYIVYSRVSMYKGLLVSVCILFLSLACSKQESSDNRDQMFFNVDTSLIQKEVAFSDIGIKIAAPKSWILLDSTKIPKINARSENAPPISVDSMVARAIYLDTLTKSLMVVSKIITPKKFEMLVRKYDTVMGKYYDSFTSQKASFKKGNMSITQYLLQNQQIVNFRFLGHTPSKSIFQIDFVIPKKIYSEEIAKAVESSLGTLDLVY